jgi:hypothetical protein
MVSNDAIFNWVLDADKPIKSIILPESGIPYFIKNKSYVLHLK